MKPAIVTPGSWLAGIAFALGLMLSSSLGQETPAEQYAALMKAYNANGGIRGATNDSERKAAVESLGAFTAKFLDLAEQHPEDPVAMKALRQAVQSLCSTDSAAQITWETNRSDFPGATDADGSAARTLALLMRDHLRGDQIERICDRLRYSYRLESGAFLRAVLESNPHREIRGAACLYLARFLNDRLSMVQLAADRPELEKRYALVFGEDYLPKMQQMQRDGLAAEIEALFARAGNEFADVKVPNGGTVGEQAKSALYEIRHLAVGLEAPDIVGRDQDGIEFALSDYRGKVLLLYFWMEY